MITDLFTFILFITVFVRLVPVVTIVKWNNVSAASRKTIVSFFS